MSKDKDGSYKSEETLKTFVTKNNNQKRKSKFEINDLENILNPETNKKKSFYNKVNQT